MLLLCIMGFLLHMAAGLTWGETFLAMVWTAMYWTLIDYLRDRDFRRNFNYPRRGPAPKEKEREG